MLLYRDELQFVNNLRLGVYHKRKFPELMLKTRQTIGFCSNIGTITRYKKSHHFVKR